MKPTYHIELEIPIETKDEYSYRPKERQATYPKIKEYIKDTYGANVHTNDVTKVINGGTNGLAERKAFYQCCKIFSNKGRGL